MGAEQFAAMGYGDTPLEAFREAKDRALYEYGHGGYSGTLAEKPGFVMREIPEDADPETWAHEDGMENDKFDDAFCVKLSTYRYMFYGWASS